MIVSHKNCGQVTLSRLFPPSPISLFVRSIACRKRSRETLRALSQQGRPPKERFRFAAPQIGPRETSGARLGTTVLAREHASLPSRVNYTTPRRPRAPRVLEFSLRARWRPGSTRETSRRFPTQPRLHRAGSLFPRAMTSASARERLAWTCTADPRAGLGAPPETWTARARAPRRTSCSPPRASTRRAARATRRRRSGSLTAPTRGRPWTRATPVDARLCTSPPAGAS